jgi:trans-aconitate 2-methyltransferase
MLEQDVGAAVGRRSRMSGAPSYTFGDNDTAAERLRLLAAAFEPSSRAFLARLAREPVRAAVDLGCGPGYTTALLKAVVGAPSTIGLDASARYVARARGGAPRGLTFAVHDVTRVPFPSPPADLIYGRFIATHLAGVETTVEAWAAAAATRGRLGLEETVSLEADDAALTRYYALVETLQGAHGQRTHIGRALLARDASSAWLVERADVVPVTLPAAVAARLHALNLRTWRNDPAVAGRVPGPELDRLGDDLEALATGARTAPPVRWRLAQVMYRRREGAPAPPAIRSPAG